MLPGAAACSYLGYIGRKAAIGREGIGRTMLFAVAVLALVSLLPILIRNLRAPRNLPSAITTIEAVELKRRLGAPTDIVVLDVRNADEYTGSLGHIAGAINIALAGLPSRLNELEQQRNRLIAVVCLSERRSTQATHLLHEAGFSDLVLVRGGMKEWNSAGLPVAFFSAP